MKDDLNSEITIILVSKSGRQNNIESLHADALKGNSNSVALLASKI